jgi:hypothetical protein
MASSERGPWASRKSLWACSYSSRASLTIAGGGSHGLFGIIGLLAIAAPFGDPFLKVPWANYLNAAPLAYVVLAMLTSRFGSSKEMWEALSMGWGAYVLILAGLVLAAFALKGQTRT